MPTLSVEKELLFTHMGHSYTDEAFDELCFEFGIELDDVTSERQEAVKAGASSKQSKALSDTVIYKIDIPANRYDLLCLEGLSRALRVFLGDMEAPVYTKTTTEPPLTMTVQQENTATIRPLIVCAVLRNLKLDPERYHSLMDLQDQLHRNLCRQRTLVAIGTHDLDNIQGPNFTYDARPGKEIEFVPLTPNDRGPFTAEDLLKLYNTDVSCKHLKPYVPIVQDSPLIPVVLDANETVLSLPPIINGHASRITLDTTNILIECTATDLTKANIVLDTMVTMFSEYCSEPFTVEPVTVQYVNREGAVTNSYITPVLAHRRATAKVDFVNSLIGIDITAAAMQELCTKVQLGPAELCDGDTTLHVTVPPTRSDILHPVDIAEDIGIAYGYNQITKRVPTTCTVGGEDRLNQLSDLLRDELARAGYTEVLTHGLCSLADNYTNLRRRDISAAEAVSLSNPANIEYQVVRTTLLPGLLKTLQHNRSASFAPPGMRLFEVSDVVLSDLTHVVTDTIVGARNARRVCAVYAGPSAGFEIIHGLVDRILLLTKVENAYQDAHTKNAFSVPSRAGWSYTIAPCEDDPVYFGGRAANVLLTTPDSSTPVVMGSFGVLHPEVLGNFDIPYPTSCLELDLELLL